MCLVCVYVLLFKMGTNQSRDEKREERKEEVIIGQAGNVELNNEDIIWSTKDIIEIVFIVAALVIIMYFVYKKVAQKLRTTIRREISKSTPRLDRIEV